MSEPLHSPIANIPNFALTGLVQRELECRSKGYPFASPDLFAILILPRASTVCVDPGKISLGKRGTLNQQIAHDQIEGLRRYEFIDVTLDLPNRLIPNPAHEERHPCRPPQKFTQTR
jgi:hypothetical protein